MSTHYSAELLICAPVRWSDLFDVSSKRSRSCKPGCNYIVPEDAKFCAGCGAIVKVVTESRPNGRLREHYPKVVAVDISDRLHDGGLELGDGVKFMCVPAQDRETPEFVIGRVLARLDLSDFGYERENNMAKMREGVDLDQLAHHRSAVERTLERLVAGPRPRVRLMLAPDIG